MPERDLAIAIIQTDQTLQLLLEEVVEDAGFKAAPESLHAISLEPDKYRQLVQQHHPPIVAVIYELRPPYRRNWDFVADLRRLTQPADPIFTYLTSNKTEVEGLASQAGLKPESFRVVQMPFELDALASAINTIPANTLLS